MCVRCRTIGELETGEVELARKRPVSDIPTYKSTIKAEASTITIPAVTVVTKSTVVAVEWEELEEYAITI